MTRLDQILLNGNNVALVRKPWHSKTCPCPCPCLCLSMHAHGHGHGHGHAHVHAHAHVHVHVVHVHVHVIMFMLCSRSRSRCPHNRQGWLPGQTPPFLQARVLVWISDKWADQGLPHSQSTLSGVGV